MGEKREERTGFKRRELAKLDLQSNEAWGRADKDMRAATSSCTNHNSILRCCLGLGAGRLRVLA